MKNRKKQKFNALFLVTLGVLVIAVIVIALFNMPKKQAPVQSGEAYVEAYNKTNALKQYEIQTSMIISVDDGEGVKQTAIDQTIKADNRNTGLIYRVESVETNTDVTSGKVNSEESSYTYYDKKYYYNLPGVSYTSDVTEDRAKQNLSNFINMISFPYDKMQVFEKEETDGMTVYHYTVSYDDVSDYVKAVCESGVNIIGEGNFKRTAEASATVKDGYVTQRTMYIECVNENGNTVVIEFVTELCDTKAEIAVPDASKYANITE